jgi:hypothetical protein
MIIKSVIILALWGMEVLSLSGPVIGVLTVPSELDDYPQSDFSSLDASYVKYIESAGAMVVANTNQNRSSQSNGTGTTSNWMT